ncbi:MAG: maltose alpha-D-glucosyltransferase [Longimicrobiales bacterium]
MAKRPREPLQEEDPLWYKDAVIYELHVRAFKDSTDDGMGDFRGLAEKLDYLQDLGVTAVWLLPFYPSPWRDDGYDISDYSAIHTAYGSMTDFKRFLREAHARGLRVITELVINHTSDQHPWFQRARRAPAGSKARDFYVWSDRPDRYREARIIFKDFESSNWTWDAVAHQYYWHRFYAHQPDLNFDNPAVHEAIFKVMDFWFRMGVDGMRLDAIPYLYEREGTNCENLPETHGFLKKLRAHLDANHSNRMFLAEANQWPEETVPYFGDGDECHMGFHFPVMPRLFMSIHMEDRFPIVDILKQTPAIPEICQWATFLRNHDELTLEMVTDEERDYMYRMYAHDPQARINLGIRRRLAPLLGNNRRKIELMNALLFLLPGTPVLYYGDEIGMGDNIYLGDRNGVRTPMQWSADRNAGFSRANPQRLYLPVIVDPEYHFETVNVEAQQRNPSSLFWWTKRLIALRKRFRAFGRGDIQFIYPDNRKILAFLRRYEDEHILVVANLSRFVQFARLDLRDYRGTLPVELFGRTAFPEIGEQPYFVTLGPHAFYFFQLEPARAERPVTLDGAHAGEPLALRASKLEELVTGRGRAQLERALPGFLLGRRWFQGKARTIRNLSLADVVPVPATGRDARLALIHVEYVEGDPEMYVLPLALGMGEGAAAVLEEVPRSAIAEVRDGDRTQVLFDALAAREVRSALLALAQGRRRAKGEKGEIHGVGSPELRRITGRNGDLRSRLVSVEQTNSSVIYADRIVLKLYRRPEEGTSLDVEIGRFLTERGFRHTPAVLGALEYRATDGTSRTLAVIQEFVRNEGDAWSLTTDTVVEFMERAAAQPAPPAAQPSDTRSLLRLAGSGEPTDTGGVIGTYLEDARILGKRTAQMHLALAGEPDEPTFAPEPFTLFYQRSLYQSMRNLAGRVLQQLATRIDTLPLGARDDANELLALEGDMLGRYRRIIERKVDGLRIRCHGDYHLGQLLFTGKDFVITDFEGEPVRPLSERRLKRSPLRDVAGMLRSFHYAAFAGLFRDAATSALPAHLEMETWVQLWYRTVAATYLRHYLEVAREANFLPAQEEDLALLLDAYLLEKAVYELGYELNNRPDWVPIPLIGILQLMESQP